MLRAPVMAAATAAVPVWASSGAVGQDASQQQEIEQRIQAEIAKAHAALALGREVAAIMRLDTVSSFDASG